MVLIVETGLLGVYALEPYTEVREGPMGAQTLHRPGFRARNAPPGGHRKRTSEARKRTSKATARPTGRSVRPTIGTRRVREHAPFAKDRN